MSVLHICPDSRAVVNAAAGVLYLHIGAGTVGLLAGAAVRIQQLLRSDDASLPNCERAVTITSNGVTHDGCMDLGIELLLS